MNVREDFQSRQIRSAQNAATNRGMARSNVSGYVLSPNPAEPYSSIPASSLLHSFSVLIFFHGRIFVVAVSVVGGIAQRLFFYPAAAAGAVIVDK